MYICIDTAHLYQEVASVTLEIEGHVQHAEVALAARGGKVAMHHADQVELVERHARYEGDSIVVVLPLVDQLLIGVAICKGGLVAKGGKGKAEASTHSCR